MTLTIRTLTLTARKIQILASNRTARILDSEIDNLIDDFDNKIIIETINLTPHLPQLGRTIRLCLLDTLMRIKDTVFFSAKVNESPCHDSAVRFHNAACGIRVHAQIDRANTMRTGL